MPDDFPYDVFLSHSAKDKAVVRPLAERLRADGVKVWFDEWVRPKDEMRRMTAESELLPSSFILHPLHEQGLERSRVLVLCMSANAFGSDWAQLESGTFRFRDPLNKERRFLVTEKERWLSVVEELKLVVSVKLQSATRLRQSILQKAFIGDL